MPDISKDTSRKPKDGRAANGGARKGAGRKATGRKYASYFLKEEIVERISLMENPSRFVEDTLAKAIKKADKV